MRARIVPEVLSIAEIYLAVPFLVVVGLENGSLDMSANTVSQPSEKTRSAGPVCFVFPSLPEMH